jgi:hypothetical protein
MGFICLNIRSKLKLTMIVVVNSEIVQCTRAECSGHIISIGKDVMPACAVVNHLMDKVGS